MIRRAAKALIMAVALTASGAPGQAQTPPEGIVWMALRDLNGREFDPADPTNRPPVVATPPQGLITAVDVSPDGKPDWLIDYAVIGPYSFCGTGGCLQRLYVSEGDRYIRAFDRQALELIIQPVGSEPRVEAWVHHLNCRDDADCRVAWAWDAALKRLVERPTGDGDTQLYGGGVDPIGREVGDPMPDDLPQQVSLAWMISREICPSGAGGGGDYYAIESEVLRLPDLNGDGLRDWMTTSAPQCREAPSWQGFSLWTTTADGDAAETYASRPGAELIIDISTTPATARVIEACDLDKDCTGRPLRWDATIAGFVG